jgi:hypothetical protein
MSLLPVTALHVLVLLALSQSLSGLRSLPADSGIMQVFFLQPSEQSEGPGAVDSGLLQDLVYGNSPSNWMRCWMQPVSLPSFPPRQKPAMVAPPSRLQRPKAELPWKRQAMPQEPGCYPAKAQPLFCASKF